MDSVNEYLEKDYIYVGSLWPGVCPQCDYSNGVKNYKFPFNRRNALCPNLTRSHVYINEPNNKEPLHDSLYMWCEDPYITTIDNLKKIEEKLVKFTLYPENKRHTWIESGVNYGECGFPTRLALNDFKFFGLPKEEHFISLDQNSVWDKLKIVTKDN